MKIIHVGARRESQATGVIFTVGMRYKGVQIASIAADYDKEGNRVVTLIGDNDEILTAIPVENIENIGYEPDLSLQKESGK